MLLLALMLACGSSWQIDRAEQALRGGDLVAAESRYRRVLDAEPDNVAALYGVGWVYHLSGDTDRAREFFKRCVRVAPSDYRGYRGLGSIAMAEGNVLSAEEQLKRALELAPDEPRVLGSLGLLYLSSDREDEALALLQRARDADPSRGESGYNLAEAQLRLGRPDEALNTIEDALNARIEEERFRGLLLELRARALVSTTAGRVDPTRCAETAPPVLAWLDRADRALDQAAALNVNLPNLPATRRLVHRRRSAVTEQCPGVSEARKDD